MKKYGICVSILLTLCAAGHAATDAFPGAEGAGRHTTGGRGGKVIYVTNLNDSGEGSLRWAIGQTGPRTILFKVAGNIELLSELPITKGDLTIAGQSAPGDGITIKNFSTIVKADNVIIRFMRFRLGKEKMAEMPDAQDAIWGRERKNIILDHCSMSWSIDECASFYDNTNFTMQWCIIAESLRNAGHPKGAHGYGGIWGGKGASFHHNLLANHDSRNARFCGSRYTNRPDLELVDFRNNVIYNWGGNNAYAAEGGSYNLIGNYYKPGPASKNRSRLVEPYPDDGKNKQPTGVWGKFFVDGNISTESNTVTQENWNGVHPKNLSDKSKIKSATEFTVAAVTTHSATAAYEKVLALAGASYRRDAVDERIVGHVKAGTYTAKGSNGSTNGLIDSQEDVGGYPVLTTGSAPVDSDNDGMPDSWELANGLNPNNNSDGTGYLLDPHYTNIEIYLNSLVEDIMHAGSDVETGVIPVLPEKKPFRITKTSVCAPGASKLKIYELNGIPLASVNHETIDTTGLSTGVYLIVAHYPDGKKEKQKIIR
ncbi:MAG: pectate lyase [Bacteroidales bacterium]